MICGPWSKKSGERPQEYTPSYHSFSSIFVHQSSSNNGWKNVPPEKRWLFMPNLHNCRLVSDICCLRHEIILQETKKKYDNRIQSLSHMIWFSGFHYWSITKFKSDTRKVWLRPIKFDKITRYLYATISIHILRHVWHNVNFIQLVWKKILFVDINMIWYKRMK